MLYKQLLEVYELLDTASANGPAVRDYLLAIAPEAKIHITRAGCTISSHCGRNTLGVLFIRTHALGKISEGSEEIPNALRQGHIAYFINTKDPGADAESDGAKLRQIATEYNVTMFTALDTVRVLLDVLEETTLTISTIDAGDPV